MHCILSSLHRIWTVSTDAFPSEKSFFQQEGRSILLLNIMKAEFLKFHCLPTQFRSCPYSLFNPQGNRLEEENNKRSGCNKHALKFLSCPFILFYTFIFFSQGLSYIGRNKWYFVSKIVLTYCEKIIVLVIKKKLLKFEAEDQE